MFINIHCHCGKGQERPDVLRLCSLFAQEYDPNGEVPAPCSVGLHPWHVTPDWCRGLERVRKAAGDPRVVALGEAGLDACCEVPMKAQREAFQAQLTLAADSGLPVLVHLVKALDTFMALLQELETAPCWIIHGFRGSAQMAEQLLNHGACLSFGAALLDPPQKMQTALRSVPIERLFLETDESDCGIDAVIQAAAQIRGEARAMLADSVRANVCRVCPRLKPYMNGLKLKHEWKSTNE